MERIDVLTVLLTALALAVVAWSKPLQKVPSWLFILLCAVFYPGGKALLSALESGAGTAGALAEWAFLISASLLFAALAASAYRGAKSLRGMRADRYSHHQDIEV